MLCTGGDDAKGSGGASDSQTGYIAPLASVDILYNSEYSYEYYLLLGNVDDIRNTVYGLKGDGSEVATPLDTKSDTGSHTDSIKQKNNLLKMNTPAPKIQ